MPSRSSLPDAELEKPAHAPSGGRPHFALFGIPVRIHPGFWIMPIVLGAWGEGATPQDQVRSVGIWTAIVFFSVMLHEMGHALLGRAFGANPSILLHAMGGVTFLDVRMSRLRSGFVSLAGPAAGLVFGTAVYFVARGLGVHPDIFGWDVGARRLGLHEDILIKIFWVNVYWGLVNLIPVLPFDGGHILAAALGPKRALATSLISAFIGAGITVLALKIGYIVLALLFGSAAISALRHARVAYGASSDARSGLDDRLGEAASLLDRGEPEQARLVAAEVASSARTTELKNRAYALIAWTHVAKGEGGLARGALQNIEPRSAVDPYIFAAVEDAAGDQDRARDVLEHARHRGMKSREVAKLLIDIYARENNLAAAIDVSIDDAKLLGRDDARAVLLAAIDAGHHGAAASLAARLFEIGGNPQDALDEARAHALAGDRDRALTALERAVRAGLPANLIRREAAFAEMVGDDRFERFLRSSG